MPGKKTEKPRKKRGKSALEMHPRGALMIRNEIDIRPEMELEPAYGRAEALARRRLLGAGAYQRRKGGRVGALQYREGKP